MQLSSDKMAPTSTEILNFLLPLEDREDKDDFGKDIVPPLPLSFDRVNKGPRSEAALFSLPYEVLGLILGYVSSDSLASLALVNHDCLQWARSRQFRSIKLDYSYTSSALITRLQNESRSQKPSIGACIRRVTVATNPAWVSHRHGLASPYSDEFMNLDEAERNKRMVAASTSFFTIYMSKIESVLGDLVMPNLELLDWQDMISLSRDFFARIAFSSTIRHLKLLRKSIEEPFTIQNPDSARNRNWPLETLHLGIYPSVDKSDPFSNSPTSASILRLCASTLRILRLESLHLIGNGPLTFLSGGSEQVPRFPSLRSLTLGFDVLFADLSSLEALVHDGLKTLNIGNADDPVTQEFLQTRGWIPALETFAWESFHVGHLPHFLSANPQITKLALPFRTSSDILYLDIVPVLCKSFFNLTSLSLVWESSIPEICLEMIASLRALEQIHLSSGNQYGWQHDWQIDHALMRKHLSKLPLLKKVAFSRDSYDSGASSLPVDRYYDDQYLPKSELPENVSDVGKLWEQKHRRMILDEAKQYIDILPKLEWLYFGQIPMQVTRSREPPRERVPEPLSHERDSCRTLLTTMFGEVLNGMY